MEETWKQLSCKPNTAASHHLAGLIISWSNMKNWPDPARAESSIQRNTRKEPIWRTLSGQQQGTSSTGFVLCFAAAPSEKCLETLADTMSLVANEDFQHILRVLNTNVDGKQKIMFALTSIKGIGRRFANIVCKKADVDMNKRAGELSAAELENLMTVVANPRQFKIPDWFLNRKKDYKDGRYSQVVSNALDMKLRDDLERLKKISLYYEPWWSRNHRGLRHYWGLRVRGQHTKTTGRRGKTVGLYRKDECLSKLILWRGSLSGKALQIHWSRCTPGIILNTTLASRIIEEDRAEEPITPLKRMLQRNMMFDDIACSLLTASYCKIIEEERVEEPIPLLKRMLQRNMMLNDIACFLIVPSYCKLNRCAPNIIVSTTLAFRIIEKDRAEEPIPLLKRMLQRNMMFNDITCSLIVASYFKLSKLDLTLQSNDYMINRGCSLNSYVYTCLIAFYSQEERIEEVVQMMEEMVSVGLKPYDEAYNHLIVDVCALLESADNKYTERVASKHASIVEEERIEEAIQMMEEMVSVGLKPYDETYNHLIVGLLRNGWTNQCLRYSEKMLEGGYLPDLGTCNEMIKTLYIVGNIEEVNRILTSLLNMRLVPNQEIYLILIDVHRSLMPLRPSPLLPNSPFRIIEEDKVEEPITLLKRMLQRNMMLDDIACSFIVPSYCKLKKESKRYNEKMLEGGFLLGLGTSNEMIKTLYIVGNIEETNRILTSL
ncbi:hypothetical protein ZIOFF_019044 [Zingiber officinale]|uniref:Ribosomal protein S13 n=1 Tax=Zingiber officinale TaxID=94328 RepID=A0A8J5LSL0_ZINOF|nr:hypothetical protein ZIOFF_019044 [Zingiber officinale]